MMKISLYKIEYASLLRQPEYASNSTMSPCSLPLPGCLLFRLSVWLISQFLKTVPFYGWASPDPLWQSVGASVPGVLVSCRDQWRIWRRPWVWRFRGFLSLKRLWSPEGVPLLTVNAGFNQWLWYRNMTKGSPAQDAGRLVGVLLGFELRQRD